MGRGKLRIHLGAAPGVGKTYAVLSEAHRRVERGTDCVVAFVEHHDRPRTEVMLHGLEQVPRRELTHRDAVFTEMDVDAVLRRAPAVVPDRQRLRHEAEQARALAEGNRIRTALLAAVSHDLRTPPAAIKAAVSSLRSDDVAWSEEDQAEPLEALEDGADRLDHLVGNLLDTSRPQTGTVTPVIRETDLDEVVPMALGGLPGGSVELDVPESLPMVAVDAGLLERAVADLVENAAKYSPPGVRVLVAASALADRVELRVVDGGPGVPDEAKDRVFEPFQRCGDAPRGAGVGLGLTVARGFTEAMDGTLNAEDTPGGGLTMVLNLRAGDALRVPERLAEPERQAS